MKTSHLVLAMLAGIPAFCQTSVNPIFTPLEKGSHFLGLNATGGYSGGPNELTKLQVTAQGGIFAARGLVTGVQLSYDKFRESRTQSSVVGAPTDVDAERTVNSFSPELFARYYFFQTKFRPILHVSAGGIFQNTDRISFSGLESKETSSGFTAAAALGLGWFVSKRISVELMYQVRTKPAAYTGGNGLRLGVSVLLK